MLAGSPGQLRHEDRHRVDEHAADEECPDGARHRGERGHQAGREPDGSRDEHTRDAGMVRAAHVALRVAHTCAR